MGERKNKNDLALKMISARTCAEERIEKKEGATQD